MLECNADGVARLEYGEGWNDPFVHFTPYVRSAMFNEMNEAQLHVLPMEHAQ